MKLSTKIIALIILIVAFGIIFYPTDETPDLRGNWSVNKLIVNGEEKAFSSPVNIYENKFFINEFNLTGNVSYKYKVDKDSLFIMPPADTSKLIKNLNDSVYHRDDDYIFFEGRYKMEVKTKIIGSGKDAEYDTHLKLVTKGKSIVLQRIMPVKWQAPVRRGQP